MSRRGVSLSPVSPPLCRPAPPPPASIPPLLSALRRPAERAAPLSKRPERRVTEHVLNIKKKDKALAVDTLNVHAPPGVTHTVCYDRGIKLESSGTQYDFEFGAGVGLGAMLASCVGAPITVETQVGGLEPGSKGSVKTLKGVVLSVEKGSVVVEGTEEVREVFTALQLLENGCKMVSGVMGSLSGAEGGGGSHWVPERGARGRGGGGHG